MYKSLIKPILFLKKPEKAHHFTFNMLKIFSAIPGVNPLLRGMFSLNDKRLERKIGNLTFPNPVGLAAGFDKNALLGEKFGNFGFGFVEIGTVTPVAQSGNPQPRLFRLPEDSAIINRMGFNNDGLKVVIDRLKKRPGKVIIGGNIGKNKVTPNEEAILDYEKCFDALYDHVDYFVVNVSSPNTPNLRALQDKEPLTALLSKLMEMMATRSKSKPLLLKIAPDLTDGQLDDIIQIVYETEIHGIIATNTTIAREPLTSDKNKVAEMGAGGLSGKPLTSRSTEVIKYLHDNSKGAFPIIGVGGIHSAEDAMEKFKAGATLVQLYTGFIYEGPSLVKRINKQLLAQ